MLTHLLRKLTGKPAVAQTGTDGVAPTPTVKKPASKKKTAAKNSRQDTYVLIGLTLGAILIYWLVATPSDPAQDGQTTFESVIPLSQLTGKIGVQPKTAETPEQRFRRENKNIPLSDGSKIPAKIVAERTRLFSQVPFGDQELTYEMRLPTSWGQSRFTQYGTPGENRYKILTNIDRFFGPSIEDKRPFVWLEVQHLDRFSTAENYMNQYFIQRGINPEAVKVQDMQRAEALFIQTREDSSYVMRTLFIINGDRLMLVTFGVPLDVYNDYRDIMGLTLASFRMQQTIDRQPEDVASYKLLNVLTFDYPARWQTRNPNRTSSLRPSVELVLPTELQVQRDSKLLANEIDGLILVNAWRKIPGFDRSTLEETIIKRLQQNRIKLRDVLQTEKALPAHNEVSDIRQTIYVGFVDNTVPTTEEFGVIQATTSQPEQEIWVTVFDNSDYTAAVTLITWPQTRNYQNWAYNVSSYDKILDTLKLRLSVY